MVDLARRNNLPWDAILGSEVAGDFKPKPRVYLAACEAFNLAPAQCMMVAAHSQRSRRRREARLTHRAHRARQRIWPGHGRGRADRASRLAAKIGDLADKLADKLVVPGAPGDTYAGQSSPANGVDAAMTLISPSIDRRRLGEEARQDVIDPHVVLLLEARVRDAGHHGELLVGVGQFGEELSKSSIEAMPSHCPRMISVGALIFSGSTTGSFAHMST